MLTFLKNVFEYQFELIKILENKLGNKVAYIYIYLFLLSDNLVAIIIKMYLENFNAWQQMIYRSFFIIIINYHLSKRKNISLPILNPAYLKIIYIRW